MCLSGIKINPKKLDIKAIDQTAKLSLRVCQDPCRADTPPSSFKHQLLDLGVGPVNRKRIMVQFQRTSVGEASRQHHAAAEWRDRDRWIVGIPPYPTAHTGGHVFPNVQFKLLSLTNLREAKIDKQDHVLATAFYFAPCCIHQLQVEKQLEHMACQKSVRLLWHLYQTVKVALAEQTYAACQILLLITKKHTLHNY